MILTEYTLYSTCKSLRNIETGTDFILLIILMIYPIQNPILRAISFAIVLSGVFLSNE